MLLLDSRTVVHGNVATAHRSRRPPFAQVRRRESGEPSSPLSRRGSIAASGRTCTPGTASCRPRCRDGAPLRRGPQRGHELAEHVVPVVETGLHCGEFPGRAEAHCPARRPRCRDGAPLRLLLVGEHHHEGDVVPVVETGLHCGPGRPVAAGVLARVVPVVETGLHCGAGGLTRAMTIARTSSPLSRRGSIAACTASRSATSASRVVPVVETGLHCGTEGKVKRLPDDESSPLSRRGSIAARTGRRWW